MAILRSVPNISMEAGEMILDAIEKRYSVRHYKDQPVEEDKLAEVLEAARLAPSGCNNQPWKLVVVRDRATIHGMVHAIGGQQFVEQAPVLIVACKNGEGYNIGHRYDGAIIDVAIALDHMTLQAASMGLGTCWLGNYDGNEIRAILDIPSENPVVAILALGYPDDSHPHCPRPRKPLSDIVCWDTFKS
jgi:nitroreductase